MTTVPPESGLRPEDAVVFRLLVHHIVDYAVFMLDADGRVLSWNPGAERIQGHRAEEAIGEHFARFFPGEDVLAGKPRQQLARAAAEDRYEDEGWRVRRDGERFWAATVLTAVRDEAGALLGFAGITRDLGEARHRGGERTGRQRMFANSVHAQESERRRIAWDVHDDSIQSMIAVSMLLQLLAEQQSGPLRDSLADLDRAVQEAIHRLRRLVTHLRPPALDGRDLAASLRGYLDDVVTAWGLNYRLQYELPGHPSPELVVTAFRIVQEALVNVHKHARASSVDVVVTEQDGGFSVTVTDDGRGIDEREAATVGGEHVGMIAMRERAESAQGRLHVHSSPGKGVTVEFWLPRSVSDG